MTRPFAVSFRYDVPDPYVQVPPEGIGFQHPNGVKVLLGYRPDEMPAVLTETDHEDNEVLALIEADVPDSDPAEDDPRLVAFLGDLRERHRTAANDVVATLRWVLARPGGTSVVGRRQSARYLVQGEGTWRPLPIRRLAPQTGIRGRIEVDEDWRRFVQSLAGQSREPIGHVILQEAKALIDSNPRSALVLTMTSLEAGLKEHLSRTVQTSPARATGQPWVGSATTVRGEVGDGIKKAFRRDPTRWIKLPTWAATRIDHGRNARNHTVHYGATPPERAYLMALARVVQDVLYLLDYQAGNDWARQYVGFQQGDSEQVFGVPVFVVEMAED